jgi:prevent-host-death family protein
VAAPSAREQSHAREIWLTARPTTFSEHPASGDDPGPGAGCVTAQDDVTRIIVMSTQSLASVKAHLSAVVDSVHETHERVTVTKNGVPTVVVMAVEDLESLEETLAILSDEETMRQLREAERDVAEGNTIDATQLRQLMARRARDE